MQLDFLHIGDWYFLVPSPDVLGNGGAKFKRNRQTGTWYLGAAYVPAELKKYFEEHGIIYHERSQGNLPAGFAAPATEKNRELMQNYAEILRQMKLAQAYDEAKLAWQKAFKGTYNPKEFKNLKNLENVPKSFTTSFLDRIRYLSISEQYEEVQDLLQFAEALANMMAPKSKADVRSWLDEAILKRKRKEAPFKRFVPSKCTTPKCTGKFVKEDRTGNVYTFRCSLCRTVIKRKFKKSRHKSEKTTGKTHTHNWIPSACGCHRFMCADPICSLKSNHRF